MISTARDKQWMSRAVALAERGRLTTSPNPMVGACIVKNNRLIAEGYHAEYGGEHAEAMALRKAGRRARGAVLYVTLEPCSTWGKTPPCDQAVKKSGIRRVIIGTLDPNPKHHAKGLAHLKKQGIAVSHGLFADEIQRQNEAFFKLMKTGLPFVTLKMAQTLDGKIAARNGSSRWITSAPARNLVHHLRREHDAVLVGKNTLMQDDPRLWTNLPPVKGRADKPWRIVIDSQGKISSTARVFSGNQWTLVAVSEKKSSKGIAGRIASGKNMSILFLPEKNGKLDLKELLKQIACLGVMRLLVEGGGELAWSLFNEKLVDRAYWMVAPKVLGGRASKTSVEGDGFVRLSDAVLGEFEQSFSVGPDWVFVTRFSSGHGNKK
ncbi:MAG: riboflavin biosynthesis protein RibD [Omnitrophica bacterium GWA2_52_8]|nr:MAG: riboflavin biosynthesis protein RibD [Omnitrophica bacterium GWA2_52_8]